MALIRPMTLIEQLEDKVMEQFMLQDPKQNTKERHMVNWSSYRRRMRREVRRLMGSGLTQEEALKQLLGI